MKTSFAIPDALAGTRRSRSYSVLTLLAAMLLLAFLSSARAAEPLQSTLGKILLPPPGVPVMAGFGSFTNKTDEDVVVVSANSESFELVEIHITTVENDVSRMRKLKELAIPAGATVELEHGGMHLMLTDPATELLPGEHVIINLNLATGESVMAHFEIVKGLHMQHKHGTDKKKMSHGNMSKPTKHDDKAMKKHEGHSANN